MLFLEFLHFCLCIFAPLLLTLSFWKAHNNKIHFSSLLLTRRVSVWFLFISITHHTSITLRSDRDRGVKMTACVHMFFFFFSFSASTLENLQKPVHTSLFLIFLSIPSLCVTLNSCPELYIFANRGVNFLTAAARPQWLQYIQPPVKALRRRNLFISDDTWLSSEIQDGTLRKRSFYFLIFPSRYIL